MQNKARSIKIYINFNINIDFCLIIPILLGYPRFIIIIKLNLLFIIAYIINKILNNKLLFRVIIYLIYYIFFLFKLFYENNSNSKYKIILLNIIINILLKFKDYITYN